MGTIGITIFVHAHLETLLETARLALIAMRLVDNTAAGARLASAQTIWEERFEETDETRETLAPNTTERIQSNNMLLCQGPIDYIDGIE